MSWLFFILMLLSALGVFVFLIVALISYIKKNGKGKKNLIFAGSSVVVLLISTIVFVATVPNEKSAMKETNDASVTTSKKNGSVQEKKDEQPTENTQTAVLTEVDFTAYAQNIMGKTFIQKLSLNNNIGEVIFYDSFTSYKSNNPNTSITEQAYKDYFNTGSAIEKIFVGESARLLRQFPTLSAVKMTLPFEGKIYSIHLDRTALNQYIGFPIESLKADDGSWQKQYVNAYTYNNEKRRAFFEKFVTVQ